MCQWCGYQSYCQYPFSPYQSYGMGYGYSPYGYGYSPYQTYGMSYGYPPSGYGSYPYYGLASGYAYTYPTPPAYYSAGPQYPRGEHRVGNCLLICQ